MLDSQLLISDCTDKTWTWSFTPPRFQNIFITAAQPGLAQVTQALFLFQDLMDGESEQKVKGTSLNSQIDSSQIQTARQELNGREGDHLAGVLAVYLDGGWRGREGSTGQGAATSGFSVSPPTPACSQAGPGERWACRNMPSFS